MKSSTRLDSALFQLTPTRTRCDLVVSANGKAEKIASGLLNPFLAHLKAARDQMAKGGYSIVLEPDPGSNASWFTKGTLERFVRFVSTPEVLERVHTLESEILQIEEAIAIQSNNEIGLQTVESHQPKSSEVMDGGKPPVVDANEDKAIVLYKPDAQPDANGFTAQEGSSKVQLLKVLETRKTVLQKEQGMAFARAVAAGFDIDLLTPLMSFAECFGASRLMDACRRFTELWKRKHENGQWLEIEAADTMTSHLDYSNMNSTGIILADMNKPKEGWSECPNGLASEETGKVTAAVNPDEKPRDNQQVPPGHHEYFQGQFPYMFPAWPMHSPPGVPLSFQPYPMQPMPYFQNSPGNSPYFQQHSTSVENPRQSAGQKLRHKRHSQERRDSGAALVSPDIDGYMTKSSDELEFEEDSQEESRKISGRSRKKQSGKVVIRNINYITPKKQGTLDGESDSQTDGEDVEVASPKIKHKHSARSSERKGAGSSSAHKTTSYDKEDSSYGNEADGKHWQAFQTYLLKEADEDRRNTDGGMFSTEKEVWLKRRKNVTSDDPLASNGRGIDKTPEDISRDMQKLSGSGTYMRRMTNDGLVISPKDGLGGDRRSSADGLDIHSAEVGRRNRYRTTADDFIMHKQVDTFNGSASDRLAVNRYEGQLDSAGIRSSQSIDDDSYVVSLRSASVDGVGNGDQKAIDIYSEFPSANLRTDNLSKSVVLNYEPDDLSYIPERELEGGSSGYDLALESEMQIQRRTNASQDKSEKEVVTDPKLRSKKEKDNKQNLTQDALRKKNIGPVRRGNPSKLNPLDEARARADKLRSYKADLQKMKKEKEEEQLKRLEALKLERQKRIASRSSSIPAQSTVTSQPGRRQVPTKLSPSSQKGSKFSDLEPGSSSPLQRYPIKTIPLRSSDSKTASKPTRLSSGSNSAENRLTRSASSLPETKKENNGSGGPERRASMTRIRRLSEPKLTGNTSTSSVRPRTELTKPKISDDTNNKKISAIISLDKSKAASLPELKTRASKASDSARSKTSKEVDLKVNDGKAVTSSNDTELKSNNERSSHHVDEDDNPIIEKTVVVLEYEKPSIPVSHASEEKHQPQQGSHYDLEKRERGVAVLTHAPVCPSVSPPANDQVNRNPRQIKAQEHINNNEFTASNKASANVSSISTSEKPYQAPYARVSSLEDPCTEKSEYGKALPTCSDIRRIESESAKAHVSDSNNLESGKIPDEMEKPSKESVKGFKRLLKFGRKNNSSTASDRDSDNVSIGGSDADECASKSVSSTEVHTLKNLISQDETPTAVTTPKKGSRTFSLLSPFRSKTSDKRPTA